MTNYDLLEDAIIDLLAPLATAGVDVVPLPDTPKKFDKPFSRPRITVAYRSSEFSKEVVRGNPQLFATDAAVQEEFASVEVVSMARTLRGPEGIHAMKSDIDELLFGFEPGTDWGPLYFIDYRFVDHNTTDGIFTYAHTFQTSIMKVQKSVDEPAVLLTNVTFITEPAP